MLASGLPNRKLVSNKSFSLLPKRSIIIMKSFSEALKGVRVLTRLKAEKQEV